jgi:hypothetical protein
MNVTQATFTIALRVQADHDPPSNQDELEIGLSLANLEVHKQVSTVLNNLFLETRTNTVRVVTHLINVCDLPVDSLCVEIEADITIAPSLGKSMEHLVVGTLRQWVHENSDAYTALSHARVTWLAPNVSSTLIGWHIDRLASKTLTTDEERIFALETKKFVTDSIKDGDRRCDSVFLLNQFINDRSLLEIHASLLGVSTNEDDLIFQTRVLQSFNKNNSKAFIRQIEKSLPSLTTVDSIHAFALNDSNVGVFRSGPSIAPASNYKKSSPSVLPFTINTTNLAIALVMLATFIQVCAGIFIVIKKSRQHRALNDDITSGIDSDDDRT